VGNPPFLGTARMREDLGDCYTETLRSAYPAMPESADFVMFWWHKAATLVRSGAVKRFGFITTNSIRQTFNRRVVAFHLRPVAASASEPMLPPLALRFAIPDHPWVDTVDGAAVRIAMTVGELAGADPTGELCTVIAEGPAAKNQRDIIVQSLPQREDDGGQDVTLRRNSDRVSPDFTLGTDVTATKPLQANDGLTYRGVQLIGSGFIVTRAEAKALGLGSAAGLEKHILPYRNGRDLTDQPREVLVIDLFGLDEDAVKTRFPLVYEHLVRAVKPERDTNARSSYRKMWWIHGEPRRDLRPALAGLPRYIATVETAKHRIFQFLDATILPDNKLVVIALSDAFHLGVLSSRFHASFALSRGALLEDRPVYPKTECFDPFPFPVCDAKQRAHIAKLAEALDAHRKRAQAQHGAGLTAIYNILVKLRANTALTAVEKNLHDHALVSTLRHLHDELDTAVAAAYDWPANLTDAEILERLVALNATRAAEEARGQIRWLRPDFQAPVAQIPLVVGAGSPREVGAGLPRDRAQPRIKNPRTPAAKKTRAKPIWPQDRPAQVEAVAAALHAASAPVSAADLATFFARAKKETIAEILSALVVLGRANKGDKRGTFTP
jgi:hypothetical protein